MSQAHTALVLSGGGTRGAYEAGVIKGITEVLGRAPSDPAPFNVFTGTSVGAINATYLASKAHQSDLAIGGLCDLWESLTIGRHAAMSRRPWAQRALMSTSGIGTLVRDHVDWNHLYDNVNRERVRALVIAALHVGTGRTAMFAHVAPDVIFRPSRDPRRAAILQPITPDHVLASAAIPGVFPPRLVGNKLFYDGSLRFNTPMAPAIRAGATRLLVVSPLFQGLEPLDPCSSVDTLGDDDIEGAPDVWFLLGKMLNAILLDTVGYDLMVLERFNTLVKILDDTLTPNEREHFDDVTRAQRGQAYKAVDTLVIGPSEDIGAIGHAHAHEHAARLRKEGFSGRVIARIASRADVPSTDLLSYLLFDGAFAAKLIELGRQDALARADEIHTFFDTPDQGDPT